MIGTAQTRDGDTLHIHTYRLDGARAEFIGHSEQSMTEMVATAKAAKAKAAELKAASEPAAEPAKKPTLVEKVKGAASIVRAEVEKPGARVPLDVVAARQAHCEPCDNNDLGKCLGMRGCGCYLWAKVREPGAECPLGLWDALT